MAIKVMANCGDQVLYTAEELGAALRTFAHNEDYVIKNIGEQLAMTYTSSSLDVTVKTGEVVMCGRFVKITDNTIVTLEPNSSGKLVLRIDLTKPISMEGELTYTTTPKTDNLNNTGSGQYDLVLAEYTSSSNGVTSFTDLRVIKDSASGSSGPTSYVTCDLLWEKTNLYDHQPFSQQQVTITGIASYKLIILIGFAGHGYDPDVPANSGVRENDACEFLIIPYLRNGEYMINFDNRRRRIRFLNNGTGIGFSGGYGMNMETGIEYDYFTIPWKVYGIK